MIGAGQMLALRKLLANTVVASYLWPARLRALMLRALGVGIGPKTTVFSGVLFTSRLDVSFGEDTIISHRVCFESAAPITVGDRVGIGYGSILLTSNHTTGTHQRRAIGQIPEPITIGDGAWLATNVTVLPGVTIGDGCVIAPGAVVREDCEPDGFYGGVPAKLLKQLD